MLSITLLIIIIILLIIIGFLSKALLIQLKKNHIHEEWIISLQDKVEDVYITIKALDNKEMFSKDDEVGVVFTQMVDIISSLNQMTSKE